MTYCRSLPLVLGLFLLGITFVPPARANEGNKEVHFTISGPLEIPRIVLPAGSYDLKLVEDGSTMAELWNLQGNRFYGFFETVPVDRAHAGKLQVDLALSQKDSPERLKDWFYPGDKQGNEILYRPANNVERATCSCARHEVIR